MVVTSVTILSLLRSRESLRHSRAGHRAERAAFSPLACVAAQSAPVLTSSSTKTSLGGDWQQDDVVVTQLVNALTRPWLARVET
jgi:hypothetical protein